VQNGEPRYRRIQRDLEDRLSRGIYPVGSLLPTEADLGFEFTASRFTVREALRKLTELGYVSRTQGRGTEVVSSNPRCSYVQSIQTLEELSQVALETWFVVHGTKRIVLDDELAKSVGGKAGEKWFCITGVRWTEPGGRSIAMIESYIPSRFEDQIDMLEQHRGAFFNLLEKHCGEPIEQVVQEIRSLAMPLRISRQLGLRPDALALQLLRRYITKDGVIIASFNWHPADQFVYKMKIDSNRGAANK
jgi:GntR family transcriptional regulator